MDSTATAQQSSTAQIIPMSRKPQLNRFKWEKLIKDSELSAAAKTAAMHLLPHMDNDTLKSQCSVPTLAKEANCSQSKIEKGLRDLKLAGLLTSNRRFNASSIRFGIVLRQPVTSAPGTRVPSSKEAASFIPALDRVLNQTPEDVTEILNNWFRPPDEKPDKTDNAEHCTDIQVPVIVTVRTRNSYGLTPVITTPTKIKTKPSTAASPPITFEIIQKLQIQKDLAFKTQRFFDHYDKNGWKLKGGNPLTMDNLLPAMSRWAENEQARPPIKGQKRVNRVKPQIQKAQGTRGHTLEQDLTDTSWANCSIWEETK